MKKSQTAKPYEMSRRGFLQTVGTTAAGISLTSKKLLAAAGASPKAAGTKKKTAAVRGKSSIWTGSERWSESWGYVS